MAQPMMEATTQKRLNYFERYLTVWVGLCMIVGVLTGKVLPAGIDQLRRLEFGAGSQINIPIAVLIWLSVKVGSIALTTIAANLPAPTCQT